jgi:hypothetical protein
MQILMNVPTKIDAPNQGSVAIFKEDFSAFVLSAGT